MTINKQYITVVISWHQQLHVILNIDHDNYIRIDNSDLPSGYLT